MFRPNIDNFDDIDDTFLVDTRFNVVEKNGIIMICGPITKEISNYVCEEIIKQNLASNRNKYIKIILNTSGGCVPSTFGIIDVIKWSSIPVHTVGIGEVCSSGLYILMAGTVGYRSVSSRCVLLSHEFTTSLEGNQSSLHSDRKYVDIVYNIVIKHYISHTKFRTRKSVEKKLLKPTNVWLTAKEALEYGIVDDILEDK